MTARPLPVPDEQTAPFWSAAAAHRLTVARCGACGEATMPPDVVCPHCGSTSPAYTFAPVGNGATVRSWTVIRQSFLPGFEADLPFVLVDVELDDAANVRLIGRLLDGPQASVQVGAAVTVGWEDVADGVSLPAFRLVT